MATTTAHIRVDEKVKEKAAKTLAAMGISVSDAVGMLLVRGEGDAFRGKDSERDHNKGAQGGGSWQGKALPHC
jgi:RelB antitoxin of RelBE toxin-antitoxin system